MSLSDFVVLYFFIAGVIGAYEYFKYLSFYNNSEESDRLQLQQNATRIGVYFFLLEKSAEFALPWPFRFVTYSFYQYVIWRNRRNGGSDVA